MRKWVLVVMLLLLACCLGCEDAAESKAEILSVEEKLVGEWVGTDYIDQSATFIFNEDKTAMMIVGNIVYDSKSNDVFWKINNTYDPIHLDIVMKKNNLEEELILPMIVRFITSEKIQICAGEGARPTNFDSDEKDLLVLTKQ